VADQWRHPCAPGVREIREDTFAADVPAGAEPAVDPREHDAFRRCRFGEALALLRWPENAEALRRAEARLRAD
jgi:hypothetical protein